MLALDICELQVRVGALSGREPQAHKHRNGKNKNKTLTITMETSLARFSHVSIQQEILCVLWGQVQTVVLILGSSLTLVPGGERSCFVDERPWVSGKKI